MANLSSHMCKGSCSGDAGPSLQASGAEPDALHPCIDGLVLVDIEILDGTVAAIDASSSTSSPTTGDATEVDAQQGMALPCFTDMHTHIGGWCVLA